MKLPRTLTAAALVLVFSASASAAVVRSVPFPGFTTGEGFAFCLVVNAGSSAGNATIVLYDEGGNALKTDPFVGLGANAQGIGNSVSLADVSPSFCECTVPSTTTWRCSFVWKADQSHITVIEAK